MHRGDFMGAGTMRRRDFMRLGLILAAASPFTSLWEALPPESITYDSTRIFFDERFEHARSLTSRIVPAAPILPVRSDVTAVWTGGLNRLSAEAPLRLMGVTTESFHFCLNTLLETHATVQGCIQRLDRDLYAWVVETRLNNRIG